MWLLMLEAGVALFLLVFIVWWTMFSGRPEQRRRPLREDDKSLRDKSMQDKSLPEPPREP